jgi:hypothetical protein
MYCKGITKDKRPCTLISLKNKPYCEIHSKYNYQICNICIEDIHSKVSLDCKHEICLNCAIKIGVRCPFCRSESNSFIQNKIFEEMVKRDQKVSSVRKCFNFNERNEKLHELFVYVMKTHYYSRNDKEFMNMISESLELSDTNGLNVSFYMKELESSNNSQNILN